MKIVPKTIQQTTDWSGGSTTELAIHPAGSLYSNRDFDFRISTASIEIEASTFTSLPGYERLLMILKGELEITHRDHYTKKLGPFETDTFDGAWQTTAKGLVTDFNVIYKPGKKIAVLRRAFSPEKAITLSSDARFHFGFVASGTTLLDVDSIMNPGDFVQLEKNKQYSLQGETTGIWLSIEIN